MLDCHVLVSDKTPRDWLQACCSSLADAVNQAGFPVELHFLQAIDGHIGEARAAGYGKGVYPYVTSVDDDDWVEPGAFNCLLAAMQNNPAAIYTHSTRWQNGHATHSARKQALRVFRRDVTASFDFGPWSAVEDIPLMRHAETAGDVIEIPEAVYNIRVYSGSQGRALRRANPEQVRLARG